MNVWYLKAACTGKTFTEFTCLEIGAHMMREMLPLHIEQCRLQYVRSAASSLAAHNKDH